MKDFIEKKKIRIIEFLSYQFVIEKRI